MRNEALPTVIGAAVLSGLVCLVIGVGATFLLLAPASPAPHPAPAPTANTQGPETAKVAGNEPVAGTPGREGMARDLQAAQDKALALEQENTQIKSERDKLRKDNESLLNSQVELKKELETAKAAQSAREQGTMPISFGNYGSIRELNSAKWGELGASLKFMAPAVKQLAADLRAGKNPDPEAMKEIARNNMVLVQLAVGLHGKVPTHAQNFNGEYTHPITQVNLLAAQLEAAGDPLTADQKARLTDLGKEYEKRWTTLQDGYNKETFLLQKLYDEADLKQWFTERMWQITTARQKAIAVDPSVEGLVGLDLYSPALMFQQSAVPLKTTNRDTLKGQFKDLMAQRMQLQRETLDGAEYAFDDWLTSFKLEPRSFENLRFMHIKELLEATRAEYELLRALTGSVLSDVTVAQRLREESTVIVPQLQQEG
ncbi:MAG: hypothetical protein IPP14_03350 [Planctomycetes bacterium]|nr:hypothetical protein [Planctomycetota bacterium]